MIRPFPLILQLLLVSSTAYSQIHDTAWDKKIGLPQSNFIEDKERITLFDSDSFTIYSSFDILVKNIKTFIKKYDVEEDKILLVAIRKSRDSSDRSLSTTRSDRVLRSRLDFRTSDLIQAGKCLIYNKPLGQFESQILVTNYVKKWRNGIRFSNPLNATIMDIETGAY